MAVIGSLSNFLPKARKTQQSEVAFLPHSSDKAGSVRHYVEQMRTLTSKVKARNEVIHSQEAAQRNAPPAPSKDTARSR